MKPFLHMIATVASASLVLAGARTDDPTGHDPLLDSLFQGNVTIKYKPGSGVTFEGANNDYSLNISGRVQAKWQYTSLDNGLPETNTFAVRRARLKFAGNVWDKDITYLLQLDFTANPNLLDAVIGWNFWHNDDGFAALSMGAQKFRAGLQSDTSSGSLEMNERTIATQTFANMRATGALFQGGFGKADEGHTVMWHAGTMNNDTAGGSALTGPLTSNESNQLDFSFGVLWAGEGTKGPTHYSEGDLAHSGKFEPVIGANILLGNDRSGGVDFTTTTTNFYVGLKFGNGFAAQGELWLRQDDPAVGSNADSMGWYAQASYTTAPGSGTQWAFVGRVSMVSLDDANPVLVPKPSLGHSSAALAGFTTGDVTEIQGGISAYYHEHKLKSQIMVTFQNVDPDAGTSSDNLGVDVMMTMAF